VSSDTQGVRTCLGCRRRLKIDQLIRLTVAEGAVEISAVAGRRPAGVQRQNEKLRQQMTRDNAETAKNVVQPAALCGSGLDRRQETREGAKDGLKNAAVSVKNANGSLTSAEGSPNRAPKGARRANGYACPEVACAQRALRVLTRSQQPQLAHLTRQVGIPTGVMPQSSGEQVLHRAAEWLTLWTQAREAGLRRRRIDGADDPAVGAWKALRARMAESLARDPQLRSAGKKRG